MKCPMGHEAPLEQFEKTVMMKYRAPSARKLTRAVLGLTTQDFLVCPNCGIVFRPK